MAEKIAKSLMCLGRDELTAYLVARILAALEQNDALAIPCSGYRSGATGRAGANYGDVVALHFHAIAPIRKRKVLWISTQLALELLSISSISWTV